MTNKLRRSTFRYYFLLGFAFSSFAFAENTALHIDASSCVDIRSHIERLTCYDQLVDAAVNEKSTTQSKAEVQSAAPVDTVNSAANSTAAPAAVKSPEVMAEPVQQAVVATAAASAAVIQQESVQNIENSVSAAAPAKQTAPVTEENFGLKTKKENTAEEVVELYSKITEVKERLPGRYQVTLENGQVWWQKVANNRYRMKVGDEVRIYPSGWGSDFRLTVVDRAGYIQVERVK